MWRWIKSTFFVFAAIFAVYGQEEEEKHWADDLTIGGYIKYLPSVTIVNKNNIISDNLIHNRINLGYDIDTKWSAEVDFRNRIVYGQTISSTPDYGSIFSNDQGLVDLSFNWIDGNAIIGNTFIDRAYLDYVGEKLEVRVGRQRINWGVNLAWNANDIFNAYSFVDFDYQERPGTDALRVQYYFTDFTNIDLAYRPGKTVDESIIGGLLKFNKWEYDFQILAGNVKKDIALGIGWAGNLQNAGFKGESTLFYPKDNEDDQKAALSSSFSVDYSFKNSFYLNGSLLINTSGRSDLNDDQLLSLSGGSLTAKNLMPTKFSYFLQGSAPINQMVSGSVAIIYGAGMDLLFFMPSLAYAIKDNWDLDFTGQIFFADYNDQFTSLGNALFLRLTHSY